MSRHLPRHDHEGIRQLCRDLESAMTGNRVKEFFEDVDLLHYTLITHIRDEDSPLGIYHEIERAVPRLQYTVRDLREQHDIILQTLVHIQKLSHDEFGKAKSLMTSCLAVLHRHERHEDELIHEAYYRDMGTAGA